MNLANNIYVTISSIDYQEYHCDYLSQTAALTLVGKNVKYHTHAIQRNIINCGSFHKFYFHFSVLLTAGLYKLRESAYLTLHNLFNTTLQNKKLKTRVFSNMTFTLVVSVFSDC